MTTKDLTRIGIAGDWHGDAAWAMLALDSFADAKINVILHLGDFGFWPGDKGQNFLSRVNSTLETNGQELNVTLGNHEDYVQTEQLIVHPDRDGFVYNPEFPNILVAVRGARWVWEGVSFVSLGGANSIDFTSRSEWVNWWKAEQISLSDVYRTIEGGHADVMVAHDCPIGVNLFGTHRDPVYWSETQLRYAHESRYMLRQAVDAVKPEMLFHGHYHFYNDAVTTLNDGVEDYDIRTIGLDKDSTHNNIGVLTLPEKTFELLPLTKW